MTHAELDKMEKTVVNKPYPRDKRKETPLSLLKKDKKLILLPFLAILLGILIIGGVVFVSFPTGSGSGESRADKQAEGDAPLLEGFAALKEGQSTRQEGVQADETVMVQTDVENRYFVTPQIENAYIIDSMVQLKNKSYKLPFALSELEKDGITLIVLGSQPPDESVTLEPNYRNGFIQVDDERYGVYLKNSLDCNYHGLTVYGIYLDGESGNTGKAFYSASGLTVGSPEAAIPSDADKIERDASGERTYYSFGMVEKVGTGEAYHGKKTQYTARNGIITGVLILDDGSTIGE